MQIPKYKCKFNLGINKCHTRGYAYKYSSELKKQELEEFKAKEKEFITMETFQESLNITDMNT